MDPQGKQTSPHARKQSPHHTQALLPKNTGKWIKDKICIPEESLGKFNKTLLELTKGNVSPEKWSTALQSAAKIYQHKKIIQKRTNKKEKNNNNKTKMRKQLAAINPILKELTQDKTSINTPTKAITDNLGKTEIHKPKTCRNMTTKKEITKALWKHKETLQRNIKRIERQKAHKARTLKLKNAMKLFLKDRKKAWRELIENSREQPPTPTLEHQAAYFNERFKTICDGVVCIPRRFHHDLVTLRELIS
jgi:hypothetical protein